MRLVLGEDQDAVQPRMQAVGERKIDDAIFAAEADGRLCSVPGKGRQAFAGAARQKNR